MSFFEPPPPPPEPPPPPPRPSRPAWFGPPDAVVGSAVALNLVIGRSEKAAIWISAVSVYPEGFEFDLEIRHRLGDDFVDPMDFWPRGKRRTGEEALDPELLRVGIAFADGRKATSLGPGWPHPYAMREAPETRPQGPILSDSGSSGGGGGHWQQGFWVWPLPPEGPLAFVCEWPAAGIPETKSEIDSALIRNAAANAIPLWPDAETLSDDGATYETHRVMLPADPPTEPEDQGD